MANRVGPSRGGGGGGDGGGRGERRTLDVPGEYLIALMWWERKRGKEHGTRYLKAMFVVAGGPEKGASFFTTLNLELDHGPALKRWELILEGIGIDHEIDLDLDSDLTKYVKAKPFKATVSIKRNGGYTNHEIERIAYKRAYTGDDQIALEAWLKKGSGSGGHPDDPGPSDDDHWPSSGGKQRGGGDGGHQYGNSDDDIPF